MMKRTSKQNHKNSLLPIQIMVGTGLLLFMAAVAGMVVRSQTGLISESGGPAPAVVGQALADFEVEGLDGKPVRLSDFEGRPVLINFWATWCPPCKREMPGLNDFYIRNKASGFVVLAVNTGETREQAAAFASEMGLQFLVAIDPDYKLSDRLLIDNYPVSISIGRDGKVKNIHIGYFSPEDLERELSGLLE